ncbi:MAG: S-layer homology domain-containing protein, partial [Firmicutes bacterium]|nr:S-layer homology domain-containing protein [Bacillota bacterium]
HYFADAASAGPEAGALDLLGVLGVLRGESGLGSRCRPGDPVTRAEFAVLVSRFLALDRASPFSQGTSVTGVVFSDSADIPAWAAEAVETCVALGIIRGRPDGLGGLAFEPRATVALADGVTMLLRALGNADSVRGGWPAGYIYRAYETGLLKGSSGPGAAPLDFLAPLTRAQVAQLLADALFCGRAYSPGTGSAPGTFKKGPIGASLTRDIVVTAVDEAAGVVRAADGRTVRLPGVLVSAGIAAPGDLVACRVLWVDGSGVALARPYVRGEVVRAGLSSLELSADGRTVQAVRLADGRTFTCAPGCLVELNGRGWPFDPSLVLPTATAELITLADRAVRVTIIQEDIPLAVVAGLDFATDPLGRVSVGLRLRLGELPLDLGVPPEAEVYLNGSPVPATALREGDIISAATAGLPRTALRVRAVRRQVVGTFLGWVDVYDLDGHHREMHLETQGGPQSVGLNPTLEEEVARAVVPGRRYGLQLDTAGQVAAVLPAPPEPGRTAVGRYLRSVTVPGTDAALVTLERLGWETTLEAPSGLPAATLEAGVLVAYGLDRSGRLSVLSPVEAPVYLVKVIAVDLATGRLTVALGDRSWRLAAHDVPLYLCVGLGRPLRAGPSLGLEALSPGDALRLDDLGRPSFMLLDLTA